MGLLKKLISFFRKSEIRYLALPEIDIVKELTDMYKEGYILSLRGSDTGIGYTLETSLKIKENNSGEPDFKFKGIPVELKAQREKASSRITLMTKTPKWSPLSPKEIIERFGYRDLLGRQGLKITLNAVSFNSKGFKLLVDRKNNKLSIVHKEYGSVAFFDIKDLMQKLSDKIYKNLILVLAESKRKGEKEYFRYNKAILLQELSEQAFEKLFDRGLIVWEFRMHIKENGGVRDHGPGFRISKKHINELYAKNKVIFDGSKFSEEQK